MREGKRFLFRLRTLSIKHSSKDVPARSIWRRGRRVFSTRCFMPLLRILTAFLLISSDAYFTFLTVTCGIALYRARRQPWTALFVASAYLNLTLLLLVLRLLDGVPRGDLGRRRPLEFAVVALAATLNATLCYQVTKLMPPAVSALLWLVAAVVSTGGALLFYGRHRPRVNRARGAR